MTEKLLSRYGNFLHWGVKPGDLIEVSCEDVPFVVMEVISSSELTIKRWGRIQAILSWNPCNDYETIWGL